MLARAAEWNCSIFRSEGLLPMEDVIKSYAKYAVDYDNPPSNTKYCIQNILREQQESVLGKRFLSSRTMEQIWRVLYYLNNKIHRCSLFVVLSLYIVYIIAMYGN